ncbi:MAG: alpha/beta fold hydrolase, partial [Myxococcales bacterium]|nr:alpha/beta fold hydrolase [Myxococcales bacterium]
EGASLRHRFETRTELLLPGRPPARAEGMLLLDARGDLVRGYERSDAAQLRFSREGTLLRLTDGTRQDEVLYDPQTRDTAFMAHSAIFHEELMLGLRRLAKDELAWRVVSLSGGVPVEWEATLTRAPKAVGGQAVLRTNLGEEIVLEGGRLVRAVVSASDLRIEALRGEVEWPSWTIEGPPTLRYEPPAQARFDARELELPGQPGQPALFGELLVPDGLTGPSPAVLWISGTGREDRHGFAGPPPVDLGGHEITDALAQAGLLVLRFDERGQGRSEPGPLSFSGQLEDVQRAYRTLVVQPEVDPDRVVLVAHGEGGLRALSLAAQHGAAISGVALLGSPGRPFVEILRHQGDAALDGVPPELREAAREQQARMLAQLRRGEVPPELADHEAWLREAASLDPARIVAGVAAPLWIGQGDADFEVDPEADAKALHTAGRSRGKGRPAELHRYPGLDHLFKPEPGRSTPARYRELGRAVDPTFLRELTTWVLAVSHPAPRGHDKKKKRGAR